MNNKIQTIINQNNDTMITYNNIDINLSLSFNNLTYTLAYENSKKYLNSNSLLFNIEDNNTIYNVFKKNNMQFSYQLNNIIFIDDKKNMHLLNYNLISYDQPSKQNSLFSIDNNDIISLNILQPSNNSYYPYQTIFAYNTTNYSYIYSNEKNLDNMSFNKQGLYYIDNNNVILNDNRLSIDIHKFNYNYNLIRNINTNTLHILKNYQENIDIFSQTRKYKNINYSANIQFNTNIENYVDKNISINLLNKSLDIEYKQENNIIIKDTDYMIIDIPIEYEYETVVNKEFQYNKRICPIDIDDIKIEISDILNSEENKYSNYISINRFKSFVHDNKCLSIYTNYNKEDSKVMMKEKCRVSLYFSIDSDIYKFVYEHYKSKNSIKFKLILKLSYNEELKYEFNCYIDILGNQFKKLYHNYNYGFNFDKHGDVIGIMLLRKNKNSKNSTVNINNITIDDNSVKFKDRFNLNNDSIYNIDPINKDIYINYDQDTINNILVRIDQIDYSNVFSGGIINFNLIETYSNSVQNIMIRNTSSIIDKILYPERLKIKNFTKLYIDYGEDDITINKYNLPQLEEEIILNNVFIDNNYGVIKLANYNLPNVVNNHYILDYNKHKTLFPSIYNYRKSGLLYGDFYTPCLQDYMMMYLFSIENYFDLKLYKEYVSHFCKEDKVPSNDTDENQNFYRYRLLSNQFYRDQYSINHTIYQYCVKLTKDDENSSYNDYKINLYNKNIINENIEEENNNINYIDVNYIWPLFRIPDYSIINSNDYIIMFSEIDNCEHIDYYINNDKHLYINFKSYNDDNNFNFFILNENLKINKSIQILDHEIIDKDNNISQIHLYTDIKSKIKIFYIAYIDSEPNMNNYKFGDQKCRILCKVYLKNESI